MSSNNNTMILVAAGIAAVYFMSKKAAATPAPTTGSAVATSVNNQLWSNILGGAWKSLVAPGTSSFLMQNQYGQVVTSDGKPVDSASSAISDALSTSAYSSGFADVSTAAPDGTDWLSSMAW